MADGTRTQETMFWVSADGQGEICCGECEEGSVVEHARQSAEELIAECSCEGEREEIRRGCFIAFGETVRYR